MARLLVYWPAQPDFPGETGPNWAATRTICPRIALLCTPLRPGHRRVHCPVPYGESRLQDHE